MKQNTYPRSSKPPGSPKRALLNKHIASNGMNNTTFVPSLMHVSESDEHATPSKRRVIICSNVLPVHLEKDDEGNWKAEWDLENIFEEGGIYAQLKSIPDFTVIHVGVPNVFVPMHERDTVADILRRMGCYPVYLSPGRAHNYFQGYCKGVLFPVFHNIVDVYNQGSTSVLNVVKQNKSGFHSHQYLGTNNKSDGKSDWEPAKQWNFFEAEEAWPDYCAVNRQFSVAVVEAYRDGDIVWVHDYHLLLVPSFVRRKVPVANIGLFLHTPFPSSEIFRTLAAREDIIKGMLSADHVGFHLFEYARHFLTCCNRMLGLPYEGTTGGTLRVPYFGRSIMVTCSYSTPEISYIRTILDTTEMLQQSENVKLAFISDENQKVRLPRKTSSHEFNKVSRQIILGIDQVDGLRGISLKLLALDKFLIMYPHRRNSIVLKQIGLLLDSRPEDYKQCHEEITGLVRMINEKWGITVVEYEERPSIPIHDRLALMQKADVFLLTVLRQGVNAMPFEYILARGSTPGVLLLSEFSACSRVMNGAIRFNPKCTEVVAMAIEQAVEMTFPERVARRARDMPFLERNNVLEWSKRVLRDIEDAKHGEEVVMSFGFGFDYRFQCENDSTEKLNMIDVIEKYKTSKQRLLVFDYSGTLVETSSIDMYLKSAGNARTWHYKQGGSRRPGGCLETRDPISDSVRSYIAELAKDPHNTVAVVSSDLRDELAHALSGIPNLLLVAENGFVYRINPRAGARQQAKWYTILDDTGAGDWYTGGSMLDNSNLDNSWQDTVETTMQQYSDRTNGSFIWTAPSAVSFNSVLADPEFGKIQSQNLVLELERKLAGLPLTIEQGKGFVTVRVRGVNRGAALRHLFKFREEPFDFILCCGDDIEDDFAFKAAKHYSDNLPQNSIHTYTCRIGRGAKHAKFFLEEPADLHDLLQELNDVTMRPGSLRRSVSTGTMDYSGFFTKDMMRKSLINLAEENNNSTPANRSLNNMSSSTHQNDKLRRKGNPSILSLVGLNEKDIQLDKPESKDNAILPPAPLPVKQRSLITGQESNKIKQSDNKPKPALKKQLVRKPRKEIAESKTWFNSTTLIGVTSGVLLTYMLFSGQRKKKR